MPDFFSNNAHLGGIEEAARRTLWFAALVAVAASLTLGCDGCERQGAGEDFVAGHDAEMFTFAVDADPETLDPGRMTGAPEGRTAFNIFEGLMAPAPTTEGAEEPEDLVVPGVAEDWEVSDDGIDYTFYLRDDARWSNGEQVTAGDFEASWKRVLDPDFPADYVKLLHVIENAKDYTEEELEDWDEVGVDAVDETTLEVTLERPTPYFLELVAFYTFYPVPVDLIEELDEEDKTWTRPEHIVTNGPYELVDYRPQRDLTLNKNDHYWDAESLDIEEARLRIIDDINAVVNAYRTGQLHMAGVELPVAQVANLMTHPDYYTEPMLGTFYFRFNVTEPDDPSGDQAPLWEPKFRRALAKSIDRRSLVEDTMNNLYDVAEGYVPEMTGYESTVEGYDYDPSRARELLEELGYEDGSEVPEFEFLYNYDENNQLIAEAVQGMWERNLGLDVTLVNKEWRVYLQDVYSLNYSSARAGWIGDYNDPTTFLDKWVTGDGNNNTGWSDEEYDELIDNAHHEPDPDQRLEYLQEAEEILMERGPIIPIYYYNNNTLVSRFIDGFEPHNRDIHLLKYMSLSDDNPQSGAE